MTLREDSLWPSSRLAEALETIARRHGVQTATATVAPPAWNLGGDALGAWLERAGKVFGLAAKNLAATYVDFEEVVARGAPALIQIEAAGENTFLLLVGIKGGQLEFLRPDFRLDRYSTDTIRSAVCGKLESKVGSSVDSMLEGAAIPEARRGRARSLLLEEYLQNVPINGIWHLGVSPGASFRAQLQAAGLLDGMAILFGSQVAQYTISLAAWWMIGKAALGGLFDAGLFAGWAMLLVTGLFFRGIAARTQGSLAIGIGGLLRKRLLAGALRLDPDRMKSEGVGQLLARVLESEAIEAMILSGGFLAVVAIVEVIVTCCVLATGAGGLLHVVLFGLFVVLLIFSARTRLNPEQQRSAETRLAITHDLIENMVGQRTRLAQQLRANWHRNEDQILERYIEASQANDRTLVRYAMVPRLWMTCAFLGLLPLYFATDASIEFVAVAIGGMILGQRALAKITASLSRFIAALIAWKTIEPIFRAASVEEPLGSLALSGLGSGAKEDGERILEANDVSFSPPGRADLLLRGSSLAIHRGDHILLEGQSGSGKSTFAAILGGLRAPMSGLVLLRGIDLTSVGVDAWRRSVAVAPQFHENHVFMGSLAFNLLLGKRWPPRPEDLDEARGILEELGLGPLLERMPGGLFQMVGDTGWQLSHGEKSRIYVARALLQRSDVVILDESFGALDPIMLERALDCVARNAKTALVIGHR